MDLLDLCVGSDIRAGEVCCINTDVCNVDINDLINVQDGVNSFLDVLFFEIIESLTLLEEVDIEPQKIIDVPEGIHIEENFSGSKEINITIHLLSEINLELDLNYSNRELVQIETLMTDRLEERRNNVARYYFSMHWSMARIASEVGVSRAMVGKDVTHIRSEMLRSIKKDLRANKKLLGHMVGCIQTLLEQEKEMWNKYNQLENDMIRIRRIVVDLAARTGGTPSEINERASRIDSFQKNILSIHDRQIGYQVLIKNLVKQRVEVWDKFGLCGEDALKIVFSGGVDVDVKVQEIRTLMLSIASIIKANVPNPKTQQKIFAGLAEEIDERGLIAGREPATLISG